MNWPFCIGLRHVIAQNVRPCHIAVTQLLWGQKNVCVGLKGWLQATDWWRGCGLVSFRRPVTDSAWDLVIGSLGNGVRFRYVLPIVLTSTTPLHWSRAVYMLYYLLHLIQKVESGFPTMLEFCKASKVQIFFCSFLIHLHANMVTFHYWFASSVSDTGIGTFSLAFSTCGGCWGQGDFA